MHAELLRIFEDDDTLEYKSFQKARSFGDIIFSVNRGKVLNRSVWRRVSQRCSKNDQPACRVDVSKQLRVRTDTRFQILAMLFAYRISV